MPAGHRLAREGTAALADFDGERLLTATAPGSPYTDLLVSRFSEAGARVTPVEAHVTGGGQLSIELPGTDLVAAMPGGTPPPDGVHCLEVPGFTMPLLVLWPAGRVPHAVRRLRDALGP